MAIRSAASLCFASSLVLLAPGSLRAQLTTGIVEGVLRAADGHPLASSPILVTGGGGFRNLFHTDSRGRFTLTLPYGRYRIAGVAVDVVPLATVTIDVSIAPTPDVWADTSRARVYPGAFSLHGVLLSREPTAVSEPLDFAGLSDNRRAVISLNGFPWTATQYKLHGVDATDSYQPGRPLIVPDVEAIQAVVVPTSFAQTTASGYGGEVGVFLAEPGRAWSVSLSSFDTGSFLASANLPPATLRGMVLQPDRFHWFTRDRMEAGGPIGKRADLFVSGAGQWASQTIPLSEAGEQRSRLLFGAARGRTALSARDQIDALYNGSRVDLSNGGEPAGLEALAGRRGAPSFILPGGFPDQGETDHLDFIQVGWTRQLAAASGQGAIQARYGYSTAHLDTPPSAVAQQNRTDLLDGSTSGAPPLGNLAVRTRQEIEGSWQPGVLRVVGITHQIAAGAGWKSSASRNRVTAPLDSNLITLDGQPTFLVELNTPLNTRVVMRSFWTYFADRLRPSHLLSIDLGARADFSRVSLPAQSSPAGVFSPARAFAPQRDLIVWNSVSPRAGFEWQVPRARGLVLRGAYLRRYAPISGRLLDFGNPNSLGGSVYQSAGHALLQRFGGPFSSISPSLRRPHTDEFHVGAAISIGRRSFGSIHLFRRDEKDRIAAIDSGLPAQAFQARSILDPGPDGIPGTFDDQQLTVYEQNSATFGQDRFLLTNPAGLRMLNTGLAAEMGVTWGSFLIHASFVAEKSHGPTNPGAAVFENDPGVVGSLLLDPNTAIHAAGRTFTDRAYIGKVQSTYQIPRRWSGIEMAAVANYLDGLVFARRLLVTGLAQGPFLVDATVRGSPEGGNRAEYVLNWNLRFSREFEIGARKLALVADILNVINAGQKIQERDLSGPAFNQRLPVAIQPPRAMRLGFRYRF